VDGLAQTDLPVIRKLPHFRWILERGCYASKVESIYPTQTYPLHATVATGAYPAAHGILSNARLHPGMEFPEWHWFTRNIRVPTLYEHAQEAGLKVCCLLWPGAAGARVAYNLPEIKPTRRSEFLPWLLLSNGRPLFILNLLTRFGWMLRGIESRSLDRFTAASASYVLRSKRPHLLMIHLLDLDRTRHYHGSESPQASKALRMQDLRLGEIIGAAESERLLERTAFVVFGDHGHIDVRHRINANIALRRAGLLQVNRKGRLVSWQAWVKACDGCAQAYLRDRRDGRIRRRLLEVLESLGRTTGIERIFDREQIQNLRLGQEIDYVLEAKPGYYFTNRLIGNLTEPAEKNHRSSHGYLPDREGYSPLFLAAGAGIKRGVAIPSIRMVDFAPTLAALLGLKMSEAEGRVLEEMLEV
jgi:predicted AlkP superfamily pyrophosphatase or phosphodiesterase